MLAYTQSFRPNRKNIFYLPKRFKTLFKLIKGLKTIKVRFKGYNFIRNLIQRLKTIQNE